MKPKKLAKKLTHWEERLVKQHKKLAKLKRKLPRKPVEDYTFATLNGPVKLSALFGGKKDLIVVHNMGAACSYCTMWADGFNGVYPHLADRAAFVVVSPDSPAAQKKFAAGRGWRFPLVSGGKSNFSEDLGFKEGKDQWWPGVSTFQLARGKIHHVASAGFGPFDPFCGVWHFFALLGDGVDNWQPKYRYAATAKKRARKAKAKAKPAAAKKAPAKKPSPKKAVVKPKPKPAPKPQSAPPKVSPIVKPRPAPVIKEASPIAAPVPASSPSVTETSPPAIQ
jgi:predicted dithiol-disulfide oxidoreductase (DUF899 family)